MPAIAWPDLFDRSQLADSDSGSTRSAKRVCVLLHACDTTAPDLIRRVAAKHPELLLQLSVSEPLPRKLAEQMLTRCKLVLSSSLHGIVLADGLRVPALRTREMGNKFDD